MPEQAFAESKYFGSGDASRMSDNEQAAPSLRNSEVLAVQYSPADAIPELNKGADDGAEIPSSSAGEQARYIFSDNPGGAQVSNEPVELPPERATVANQSLALSCNAVVLARESSAEQVNRSRVPHVPDIAIHLHLRPVVPKHLLALLVDYHHPDGAHTGPSEAQIAIGTSLGSVVGVTVVSGGPDVVVVSVGTVVASGVVVGSTDVDGDAVDPQPLMTKASNSETIRVCISGSDPAP
jgi:hypothetical protein